MMLSLFSVPVDHLQVVSGKISIHFCPFFDVELYELYICWMLTLYQSHHL